MAQVLWHSASKFPTPGIPLVVVTRDGKEYQATRPNYAQSYQADPDYRDTDNNPIKEVIKWRIL